MWFVISELLARFSPKEEGFTPSQSLFDLLFGGLVSCMMQPVYYKACPVGQ
jgi:hypothetical protein